MDGNNQLNKKEEITELLIAEAVAELQVILERGNEKLSANHHINLNTAISKIVDAKMFLALATERIAPGSAHSKQLLLF